MRTQRKVCMRMHDEERIRVKNVKSNKRERSKKIYSGRTINGKRNAKLLLD